jgi:hypothetical protein
MHTQRLQPPEEPAANIEWDEDGMTWKDYCQKVVKSLAESPDQLAESLGISLPLLIHP